ncbi:grasp-with-spasm system SPASM domain peptide maturase [Aureispira sp. CCB-QB1]|uniref:grasp-with-spasm system SPASM domain peptide maturase n=1 Tax=Aureispira sp. CCB-QB1 TaxID=1313421 RepID=UPI00069626CF|nr:grasp-with-spasm system SPASM domain peptide maturase [Aureispira sp. CCB-QB1]
MSNYIKLHANCIIVKGISRSILCDLQRGEIFSLPDGIVEIFTKYENLSIDAIFQKYDKDIHNRIQEFFDYLEMQDLAFYTSTPQNFPALNIEWKHPSNITNAILDFDEKSTHDVGLFVDKLTEWGCKGIEVRCFHSINEERLYEILSYFKKTRIRDVKVFFAYNPDVYNWNFEKIFVSNQRTSSLFIHSAPKDEQLYKSEYFADVGVYLISNQIHSESHCGAINTGFFAVNVNTFTEAQVYNTCLNRKISVDKNGQIKNCPSMKNSYGHVETTDLDEVIRSSIFKEVWNIKKDDIKKCKTCEFRYICTDCRAYLENPDDIYSAPLKCGYDPITGEWEEWSQNPLKKQAIQHYKLNTIITESELKS